MLHRHTIDYIYATTICSTYESSESHVHPLFATCVDSSIPSHPMVRGALTFFRQDCNRALRVYSSLAPAANTNAMDESSTVAQLLLQPKGPAGKFIDRLHAEISDNDRVEYTPPRVRSPARTAMAKRNRPSSSTGVLSKQIINSQNKNKAYHMHHRGENDENSANQQNTKSSKRPMSAKGPWARSSEALQAANDRLTYLDRVHGGSNESGSALTRRIPKANVHVSNLAKPRTTRRKFEDEQRFQSIKVRKRPKSAVQVKREAERLERFAAMSKPRRICPKYRAPPSGPDWRSPSRRQMKNEEEVKDRELRSPLRRRRPLSAPPSNERRTTAKGRARQFNLNVADAAAKHVEKCIKRREKKIRAFKSFLNNLAVAHKRGAGIPDTLLASDSFESFVDSIRVATLEVVAAIESWRKQVLEKRKSMKAFDGRPPVFTWKEENYLLVIPESLDFMGTPNLEPVVRCISSKMNVFRNPFLLCEDAVWADRAPFFTGERVILEEEKREYKGFHRGHLASFSSNQHSREVEVSLPRFRHIDHASDTGTSESSEEDGDELVSLNQGLEKDDPNVSFTSSSRSVVSAPNDALALYDIPTPSHGQTNQTRHERTPADVKIKRLSQTVEDLREKLYEAEQSNTKTRPREVDSPWTQSIVSKSAPELAQVFSLCSLALNHIQNIGKEVQRDEHHLPSPPKIMHRSKYRDGAPSSFHRRGQWGGDLEKSPIRSRKSNYRANRSPETYHYGADERSCQYRPNHTTPKPHSAAQHRSVNHRDSGDDDEGTEEKHNKKLMSWPPAPPKGPPPQRALDDFVRRRQQVIIVVRKNNACITIQSAWRGAQARKQLKRLKARHAYHLKILEDAYDHAMARKKIRTFLLKVARRRVFARKIKSAILLQAFARMIAARILVRYQMPAAVRIQSFFRTLQAKITVGHLRKAKRVRLIQLFWREYRARQARRAQKMVAKYEKAAVAIQCAWRLFCAKRIARDLRSKKRKQWLHGAGNDGILRRIQTHLFLCSAQEEKANIIAKAETPIGGYRPSMGTHFSPGKGLVNACRDGDEGIVRECLASGADVGQSNERGETPLHFAAANGHSVIMRLLLEMDASVKAADTIGRTPLHLAAENDHPVCIKLLLEARAQVNAQAHGATTALHICATLGHEECASALMLFDADTNARNSGGQCPIHCAAESASIAVLRMLADHDADIDAVDARQNSPLHLAVEGGHEDVVRMLLGYAAQTSQRNASGETPSAIAERQKNTTIGSLLSEYGATPRDLWRPSVSMVSPALRAHDNAGGEHGEIDDWEMYVDEESGSKYWYSYSTGHSKWVIPEEEEVYHVKAPKYQEDNAQELLEATPAKTAPHESKSFRNRLASWVGYTPSPPPKIGETRGNKMKKTPSR